MPTVRMQIDSKQSQQSRLCTFQLLRTAERAQLKRLQLRNGAADSSSSRPDFHASTIDTKRTASRAGRQWPRPEQLTKITIIINISIIFIFIGAPDSWRAFASPSGDLSRARLFLAAAPLTHNRASQLCCQTARAHNPISSHALERVCPQSARRFAMSQDIDCNRRWSRLALKPSRVESI